jgi:Na+-driven multidrug efflux pump
VAGAALAIVAYQTLCVVALARHLQAARSPLTLRRTMLAPRGAPIAEILRIAGPAVAQVAISNLTLMVVTGLVGHFGAASLAGYGLALRLELLLTSIMFALGIGTTTMISTCLGANLPERARRITWVSALLGMALFEVIGLAAALLAEYWLGLFSHDPAVIAAGVGYLRSVGPVYGFSGVATLLFFASQGWGRMAPPVVAALSRVTATALGGWLVVDVGSGGLTALNGLLAAIPPLTGATSALLVWRGTRSRRS